MDKRIPVELNPTREISIEAEPVARALDLEVEAFRRLMDKRKIAVLCERGIDADAGHYRATFYFERKRARLIVDASGKIVGQIEATERA